MRYAIISDIHGNAPALDAVLNDAGRQDIDKYIFLGDYYADFPYPNETAQRIFAVENSTIIRGNKEDYLIRLSKEDQSTWHHTQLAALYWNYRIMDPNYLHRYMRLPEYVRHETPGGSIHIAHSSNHFFDGGASLKLGSHRFMKKMDETPFTHAEYLAFVHEHLSSNAALQAVLEGREGDVYLFGHTHLQWHTCVSGVHMINPGSCGLPLDFDVRPAYTVLDDTGGTLHIDERRVEYDIPAMIRAIKKSEAYPRAKVWYDIVILELSTAKDYISRFFLFAGEMAARFGETRQPYSDELWQAAGKAWFDGLAEVTRRL